MLPRLLVKTKMNLLAVRLFQATNDYSITVSQEFANEFWKKELTQVVYELYPGIMEGLKRLNFKVRLICQSNYLYFVSVSLATLCP